MKEGTKKVQPKPYTAKRFSKEYQALCKKSGFRIVVTPVWLARDDGTWSMSLQTAVGKLPAAPVNEVV